MPQRNVKDEVQEHHHVWRFDGYSQDNCVAPTENGKCRWIKVSAPEYQKRKDEWNNYFDMVKNSISFSDFKDVKEAYRIYDYGTLKDIREQSVSTRCRLTGDDFYGEDMYDYKEDEYMPKPHFPDPERYTFYQVEGVR